MLSGIDEQTYTPTYKTGNWPARNNALKRRGSLTIWSDPKMRWDVEKEPRHCPSRDWFEFVCRHPLGAEWLAAAAMRARV